MRFRLTSKSMTLVDLIELLNSNFLRISRDLADFGVNNG